MTGHTITFKSFFFVLFALLLSHTRAQASPNKEAYVSLLYGDSYALAVRVLMRSLLVNSPDVAAGKRDRVVLVTGDTPYSAVSQLESDGVKVIHVPMTKSPYANDAKFQSRFALIMTKLAVFNQTQYSHLVFLDGDGLVLRDLSPLFKCGHICAVFINPCHFNAGLMSLTPNQTLYADMLQKMAYMPSYDGGDQGFLNSYLKPMLSAPFFNASKDALPLEERPRLERLPFGWHVDHSYYFTTFNFAFEPSGRCGRASVVEWLGPPIAKPWLWWTYAVLDLSWVWYKYRILLDNPYPPGTWAMFDFVTLMSLAAGILWSSKQFLSSSLFFGRLSGRLTVQFFEQGIDVYVAMLVSLSLWGASFFLAVSTVPSTTPPYVAAIMFAALRTSFSTVVMITVGVLFCLPRGVVANRDMFFSKVRGSSLSWFGRIVLWASVDAVYLILWSAISWAIPFPSMWEKALFIFVVILSQIGLTVVILGWNACIWMSLGDVSSKVVVDR